jgi:uncharacterized protein (DUF1810 family)
MTDPDLIRFLDAQDQIYQQVLKELAAGRKETHWMTAAARYHSWRARTDSNRRPSDSKSGGRACV